MPYTATTWVNGTTPVNATNMNHLETGYTEASLSMEPDFFTAGFVLTGYTAVKDGGNAKQLDVAAGTAYLLQSDGTTRQRKLTSSTQTTSALSSTYHLYLQPDGTWYWSTSNSPAANSLAICTVTTDGSGNISTVTDARVTAATLLPAMVGLLTLPHLASLNSDNGALTTDGSGNLTTSGTLKSTTTVAINGGEFNWDSGNGLRFIARLSGAANGIYFTTWDGSSFENVLSIGGNYGVVNTTIMKDGSIGQLAGQTTAGSFGVPVIVAQAIDVSVTSTTQATILSYTPTAQGVYRVSAVVTYAGSGGSAALTLLLTFQSPYIGATNFNMAGLPFSGTSTPELMGGSFSWAATKTYPMVPAVIECAANQPITVKYTSPNATPADHVTVIVERLA